MGTGHFGVTLKFSCDTDSPNVVCCRDVLGASIHYAAAYGPKAHGPPSTILRRPHILPREGICTSWVPRTLWKSGESSSTQIHQMPPVAATKREHPSMMQLLLALRLTGSRAQFFAIPAGPLGKHLHGMGPRNFAGTWGISVDTIPANVVCCLSEAGASSMMQLPLALRLTGSRAQFLAVPACPP